MFSLSFFQFDFTYHAFLTNFKGILMLAILTMSLSLFLKTLKILMFQVLFFLLVIGLRTEITTTLEYVLLGAQFLLLLYILYRIKKAVDRNYRLILEKTHQIPPELTKSGQSGSQTTFM